MVAKRASRMDRKPPGFWKREARRSEQNLLFHMALLNEPNMVKVYTMALGNWVRAVSEENASSSISQEQYIGQWMSRYLERVYWKQAVR